ncbi:MAG: polysulfide reductase NrfD [Deltaproteobacteria bacterium]|nr:polysulfide reductase NrfD [Deltaproteobacteria bacterium]
MIEKAFYGSKKYWAWIVFLFILLGTCFHFYLIQFSEGLTITGMSRNVSWGLYIAQFTYLVGVAASAVMLVIPYYLHHYKAFSRMMILGEFMAIAAVTMCMLFIFVDLGQPMRVMNVLLYPQLHSVMFWDMTVLGGYLVLNLLIGFTTLEAERKAAPPPGWVKPLIYLSVLWAISIHTVTAFLYAGLPGRPYWMSAIMAARFLAGAFCSGPAILLLLVFLAQRFVKYRVGEESIKALAKIVAYAMSANVFFLLLEVFTAFYSRIPDEMNPFKYLFAGLDGHTALRVRAVLRPGLGIASLAILIPPQSRNNTKLLTVALIALVVSTWIDKGFSLIAAGFVPNPFGRITEYLPTFPEIMIALGVYTVGLLILTVLWKVAISVKEKTAA